MRKIFQQLALLIISLHGCQNKPTDYYSNNLDIRNARDMKVKCDSVYFKEIDIEIIHENLDSAALSGYKLIIDINGVVYDGPYKLKFNFPRFELCDDFEMNHNPLIIYMIDPERKIRYKWRNDKLFAFEKYSNFKVKLKSKYTPHAEDDLNSYFIDYN